MLKKTQSPKAQIGDHKLLQPPKVTRLIDHLPRTHIFNDTSNNESMANAHKN